MTVHIHTSGIVALVPGVSIRGGIFSHFIARMLVLAALVQITSMLADAALVREDIHPRELDGDRGELHHDRRRLGRA